MLQNNGFYLNHRYPSANLLQVDNNSGVPVSAMLIHGILPGQGSGSGRVSLLYLQMVMELQRNLAQASS